MTGFGGNRWPAEGDHAAAVREVGEELGIEVAPGRILVVDWVPPLADRTEARAVGYDGGILDPNLVKRIRLNVSGLRSWAWSTLTKADERLSALLARRIRACVQAAGNPHHGLSRERIPARLTPSGQGFLARLGATRGSSPGCFG
jgi:hypothetical protein